MNKKKNIFRSFFVVLVIIGILIGSAAFAKEGPKEEKDNDRLAKVLAYDPEIFACLNINNLWMWERQDGKSNHSAAGRDGVEYPRATTHAIYQDGVVWGARAYSDAALTIPAPFDQEIRVMGATYGTGSREGWVEGFGATAVAVPKDDPRARIYRIRRDWRDTFKDADGDWTAVAKQDASDSYEIPESDVGDTELNILYDDFQWAWDNWPVDLGAPFIDRNGNGVYDPPPSDWKLKDLIEQAYDEPGIAGADVNSPADMVIWNVYNDLYPSLRFGSEPTGMEVQNTVWAYKRSDALGNMYFRKLRLINKGGIEIDEAGTIGSFYLDSMYVVQWSDPDLGNAGDDLLGCDTLLSLGYVYNGNAVDDLYKSHFLPPPAAGYDYLQGPALPSPGDVAVFDLKYKQNYKNLGMTGFSYFSAGSPYSDPSNSTYSTGAIRWYKMMRGFAPLSGPDERYNHPPGVTAGAFPLAGDPVTGEGHIDGQGEEWSFVPGDRRLLIITGPWTMAPGDTQEVVVALVCGIGADRISSIAVMKFNDRFAQNTYDALFQVPSPPGDPVVAVSVLNEEILLEWGSSIEKVKETEESITNPGDFRFEGYNVYQVPTGSSIKRDAKRIATYDLVNEFTVILDQDFDPNSGQILELPVHFGSNSGIQRQFVFDRDYIADFDKITNGKEYYLVVTAYSVANTPDFLPGTLESNFTILKVTAADPFGVVYNEVRGDTISASHVGVSDGNIYPIIVDPAKLTGHDYKVTFTDLDGDGNSEWTLTDVTTNSVLIYANTNQTGNQDYLVTDGFQLRVQGAPLSVKNFLATANGAGPIDPPTGAAADFQGFPVPERPGDSQQVGAGKWMINTHTYNASNYRTFAHFLARSFVGNGITAIIPNDLEIRFTAGGGKVFDNWGAEVMVDVPFELWHTGMDDDPADDYRLFAYMLDNNGNGLFDMAVGADYATGANADHGASGGTNDPFTDRLYWMAPTDNSPGTQGYDNLITSITNDPAGRPGWSESIAAGSEAWSIVTRLVWLNWNGGDVLAATSPADYNQAMPETGTIFKIQMTKPNGTGDTFTFTAPTPETNLALDKKSAEKVGVFPNPYYAFSSLEVNRLVRYVTFNNLPNKVNIRIFNLAGHLVRLLEKDDDTQFVKWDLMNQSLVPVASGIYVAFVDMPSIGVQKSLKLVIVQEAEILPVY